MRKVRLELDALKVESFDTTAVPGRRAGTVRAHADAVTEPVKETDWDSCWGTCENGETCCTPGCDSNYETCWDTCETCPLSCYGSCVHSCESICTRQWTECPTGDRGVCCV